MRNSVQNDAEENSAKARVNRVNGIARLSEYFGCPFRAGQTQPLTHLQSAHAVFPE